MSFIQYIRGERRGRDARNVELRSLGDPYMYRALLGYDKHPRSGSDKVREIAELGDAIGRTAFVRRRNTIIYAGAAVVVVAVAAFLAWMFMSDGEAADTPAPAKEQTVAAAPEESAGGSSATLEPQPDQSVEVPADDVPDMPEEAGPEGADTAGVPVEDDPAPEPSDEVAVADSGALPVFTINPPEPDAVVPEGKKYVSVPQVGKQKYNEYLRRALVRPEDGGTGDVLVTFRVNRYGRPSEMRAEKGFSREANREAIRLLNNGPEWTPTEERVAVTIHFR